LRLPPAAQRALRRHVLAAASRLDPLRYNQEPAYVAALFARLDGVVYHGSRLTIEIRSTIVDDRGPRSAESRWGADFGIVADIHGDGEDLEKAALGQAKKGSLIDLPAGQSEDFREQIVKMGHASNATLGLQVPAQIGAIPDVRILEVSPLYGRTWAAQSGPNRWYERTIFAAADHLAPPILVGHAMGLDRYIGRELIACSHGDERQPFVTALSHSSLRLLRVTASEVA
jgi:hypothetical protein